MFIKFIKQLAVCLLSEYLARKLLSKRSILLDLRMLERYLTDQATVMTELY